MCGSSLLLGVATSVPVSHEKAHVDLYGRKVVVVAKELTRRVVNLTHLIRGFSF
jgi:hypothetical protein